MLNIGFMEMPMFLNAALPLYRYHPFAKLFKFYVLA